MIDAAQRITLAGMKGGYEIAKQESKTEIDRLRAEVLALRNINTELLAALQELSRQCDTVPVFLGKEGVKGVREAAKFMKAIDNAKVAIAKATAWPKL